MPRVALFGSTGYVGQAFRAELAVRNIEALCPTRRDLDFNDFGSVVAFLRREKPEFLINSAGYTGKPNVDACETARADTLLGNAMLPLTLAHACEVTDTPWGHVSSGCIYSGAKLVLGGETTVCKDLLGEQARSLLSAGATITGYQEADTPTFTFRDPPCSFYSGTKALGEEVIAGARNAYVWRLRIPFDHRDNPRNYLTKIQRYPRVYDNYNSLSHLGHYARGCINLWSKRAPFGVYNMTNPGFVRTRDVVELIKQHIAPDRTFEYWSDDSEFYAKGAHTPRSNCVLDSSKAQAAGAGLPDVHAAVEEALRAWVAES